MDYQEWARELLNYLIIGERIGHIIQGNIAEIAKGELAVLIYLLDENDGASASEISQRFDINTSRVAAILNALSKKEYIERKSDPCDKRRIHVYITSKGRQYGEERRKDILEHVRRMLEQLGEEDAREHIRIMKKISNISQNFIKHID